MHSGRYDKTHFTRVRKMRGHGARVSRRGRGQILCKQCVQHAASRAASAALPLRTPTFALETGARPFRGNNSSPGTFMRARAAPTRGHSFFRVATHPCFIQFEKCPIAAFRSRPLRFTSDETLRLSLSVFPLSSSFSFTPYICFSPPFFSRPTDIRSRRGARGCLLCAEFRKIEAPGQSCDALRSGCELWSYFKFGFSGISLVNSPPRIYGDGDVAS